MRKGFTLIELIFVIVIIGILAAVAIPKFKYLKQNAEVANVVAAISDLNGSGGGASYLNATELNEIKDTDLNITNLYKFQGAKWTIDNSNDQADYNSTDGYMSARFLYNDDGTVTITLKCTDSDGVYSDIFDKKGYDCNSSGNTYTIKLETQE